MVGIMLWAISIVNRPIQDQNPLKIVFMGTPSFAVPVLSAMLEAGHDVVGVYTQPDRLAGRGRRTAAPAVKKYAAERELLVFQPASLRRDEEAREELASMSPDAIVVAAYGLFLPGDTLEGPRLGALNVHPSLLPRYRGPSPVASAILNGDAIAGVTIMQIDEGMDSGPIVAQQETRVAADETAEELTARLFEMGAALLAETLPQLDREEIHPVPQDDSLATVTRRLSREDGEIDWGLPAAQIARQVRAYQPWPGSHTRWRRKSVKITAGSASEQTGGPEAPPALVIALPDGGLGVGTGDGILEIGQLQLQGRRVLDAREFVLGQQSFVGSLLGT